MMTDTECPHYPQPVPMATHTFLNEQESAAMPGIPLNLACCYPLGVVFKPDTLCTEYVQEGIKAITEGYFKIPIPKFFKMHVLTVAALHQRARAESSFRLYRHMHTSSYSKEGGGEQKGVI